jgi:hypothetical protein
MASWRLPAHRSAFLPPAIGQEVMSKAPVGESMSWPVTLSCLRFQQGERKIRGTGIYPTASLLNHECLPNVARVDNFDAPGLGAPHNTAVRMRFPALHNCSCLVSGMLTISYAV